MLANDPSLPPKPHVSIFGLMALTAWVALLLQFPNWWWRFLCITEVIAFLLFVEFVVMNFPTAIQTAMERNTIRLDGSVSPKRVKIENAVIKNFRIEFLFCAGCVLAVVNLLGLIHWVSLPMWERMQQSFIEQSSHPDAGTGIIFDQTFRLFVVIFISLFLVFVVGGAVYFRLLAKLRFGVEQRFFGYMDFDKNKLDRASVDPDLKVFASGRAE